MIFVSPPPPIAHSIPAGVVPGTCQDRLFKAFLSHDWDLFECASGIFSDSQHQLRFTWSTIGMYKNHLETVTNYKVSVNCKKISPYREIIELPHRSHLPIHGEPISQLNFIQYSCPLIHLLGEYAFTTTTLPNTNARLPRNRNRGGQRVQEDILCSIALRTGATCPYFLVATSSGLLKYSTGSSRMKHLHMICGAREEPRQTHQHLGGYRLKS